MRKIEFANNEYYHIYNRGVDKREVFSDKKDYLRFLQSMRGFNNTKPTGSLYLKEKARNRDPIPTTVGIGSLIEFICYCLNPNHFHMIVKQLTDGGISELMKRVGTGYTTYFNKKYNRSGSLFQGKYKFVHVDTNEYLLWLSGYINGNAEIHKIAKAENYKWCSYSDYMGKRNGTLCNKEIILAQFKNVIEYKKFVDMVIMESGKRKDLEKYFIE